MIFDLSPCTSASRRRHCERFLPVTHITRLFRTIPLSMEAQAEQLMQRQCRYATLRVHCATRGGESALHQGELSRAPAEEGMNVVTPRYDEDFYAWTQHQAALLRTEKWQDLDYTNLAEELESLGKRDLRELESLASVRPALCPRHSEPVPGGCPRGVFRRYGAGESSPCLR